MLCKTKVVLASTASSLALGIKVCLDHSGLQHLMRSGAFFFSSSEYTTKAKLCHDLSFTPTSSPSQKEEV